MFWWILALAIVTILSYLTDVGMLSFLRTMRVPFLDASILSVLILLCMLGILVRMLYMSRKGEKENLDRMIKELEKKLTSFTPK